MRFSFVLALALALQAQEKTQMWPHGHKSIQFCDDHLWCVEIYQDGHVDLPSGMTMEQAVLFVAKVQRDSLKTEQTQLSKKLEDLPHCETPSPYFKPSPQGKL